MGEVVLNQQNFADVIDGWVKARRGGPSTREQLRASCCHRTRMFWEALQWRMEGRDEMKGRSVGRSVGRSGQQECNLFAVKCAEKSPPHDDGAREGAGEGRSYSHEGRSETKGPSCDGAGG